MANRKPTGARNARDAYISADTLAGRAWERVADGYAAALEIPGLPEDDAGLLRRGRSAALRAAGEDDDAR